MQKYIVKKSTSEGAKAATSKEERFHKVIIRAQDKTCSRIIIRISNSKK